MLLPCTVTEADPVVCLFTCVIVLTIVLSKVNDIVIVFSMFDVVTTKRLVLRTADIVEHKTTVSDLQFVLSLMHPARRQLPMSLQMLPEMNKPVKFRDGHFFPAGQLAQAQE